MNFWVPPASQSAAKVSGSGGGRQDSSHAHVTGLCHFRFWQREYRGSWQYSVARGTHTTWSPCLEKQGWPCKNRSFIYQDHHGPPPVLTPVPLYILLQRAEILQLQAPSLSCCRQGDGAIRCSTQAYTFQHQLPGHGMHSCGERAFCFAILPSPGKLKALVERHEGRDHLLADSADDIYQALGH